MKHRAFSTLDRDVSEIGLGCWQIGGAEWGDVTDAQALETLAAAAESGVTFFDTADIYGNGRSERLVGQFLREQSNRDRFFIATKLGRRHDPGWPENFTPQRIREHTEDSLRRLGVDAIDLTQTHCLPLDQMRQHGVFDTLADLKHQGKILAFGASVETIADAKDCLRVPELSSLQIIFNLFRQLPVDELFSLAAKQRVALIVRLPLASGLLSGKFNQQTQFASTDHRFFNRNGERFNVGETFSGMPWEQGLEIVDEFRSFVPAHQTMAQWALRWCLDFPEVTVVIPGAKHAEQARQNALASQLPRLTSDVHEQLKSTYQARIAPMIRGAI